MNGKNNIVQCLYLPHAIRVSAGTDTNSAKLPTWEAILRWFRQEAEGTIVGLILCKWVQIDPLTLPAVCIGFT